MVTMSSPIDLTSTPEPMDLNSWIGVGKVYRDVPVAISRELEARTSVTDTSRLLLPPPHLPIAGLLTIQLPPPNTSLSFISAKNSFTDTPPNTPVSYLLSVDRALPPKAFLTKLRGAAGQAMLDGSISIKYWGEPDVYLPFEACGFLYELIIIAKAQAAWKSALKWVDITFAHDVSLAGRIASITQSVSWGGLIPKLCHTALVTDMTDFLSTSLLSSSHIDAMLLHLRARVRDELGNRYGNKVTIFPSILFTDRLRALGSNKANSNKAVDEILDSAELSNIGKFISTSPQDVLLATISYWPKYHWGFIMITISGGRVQAKWGDGLHKRVPLSLEKGIKMWSKRYLPQHVVTVDGGFPCAVQTDGYSCGIVAINALKHHVLGEPFWTMASREQCRINEFLGCMEFCKDMQLRDSIHHTNIYTHHEF